MIPDGMHSCQCHFLDKAKAAFFLDWDVDKTNFLNSQFVLDEFEK